MFPSKADLTMEWQNGWFNNLDELRYYVPGAITPEEFKEITGKDFEQNKETPAENGGGAGTPAN